MKRIWQAVTRRSVVLGGVSALLLTATSAHAQSVNTVKPPEAWAMMQKGQVVLIDVRSPKEWRQTGVPKNARLVTVHDARGAAGFVNGVRKVVRGDLKKPVALICRSGNRSAQGAAVLIQAGFKNVYNVSNGVMTAKGWADRGLPMERCGACSPEN
jgi:rhodanese-related sulfurtransferase